MKLKTNARIELRAARGALCQLCRINPVCAEGE